MSFAKKFKAVNAVELDDTRFEYLQHNLSALGLTNVKCLHGSYTELFKDLEEDAVFLDPPWGGPEYMLQKKVSLFFGDQNISVVVSALVSRVKLIVLKLPNNFDMLPFLSPVLSAWSLLSSTQSRGEVSLGLVRYPKMLLLVLDFQSSAGKMTSCLQAMQLGRRDGVAKLVGTLRADCELLPENDFVVWDSCDDTLLPSSTATVDKESDSKEREGGGGEELPHA